MIAFGILAILLIATAIYTITQRSAVHSVIGLLANFATLAIVYLTLQAEFLAVMQIVVYSGAILILFVFVIALLSAGVKPFDVGPDKLPRVRVPAIVLAVIALLGIGVAAQHGFTVVQTAAGAAGDADVFGSVADFGRALFTTYLLPFEATAFVLMVAVVGVVLIAGDEGPDGVPRPRKKRREPIVKREPIVR